MSAQPIRVMAPRYRCPFCTHSRASKAASAAHIGRCWHNPDVRACTTCAHYQPPGDGEPCLPGRHCDCNNHPESCEAGVDLPGGPAFPVTGCPKWASADGAP